MARGPIVTPEVENYISQVYSLYDKKWKAIDVQKEVVYNLNHDLALRKRLNLPSHLPPNWPGLNKVQRVLAKIRQYDKGHPSDPQDKPWSIASLEDYPIDPQSVPVVMHLYYYRLDKGYSKPTIREAKWVNRLGGVFAKWPELIKDFGTEEERETEEYNDEVSDWRREGAWLSYYAFAYAFFEKNHESIGGGSSEFNSETIDDLLVPDPDPNTPKPTDAALKTTAILDIAYRTLVMGVQIKGVQVIKGVKNERPHNKEG